MFVLLVCLSLVFHCGGLGKESTIAGQSGARFCRILCLGTSELCWQVQASLSFLTQASGTCQSAPSALWNGEVSEAAHRKAPLYPLSPGIYSLLLFSTYCLSFPFPVWGEAALPLSFLPGCGSEVPGFLSTSSRLRGLKGRRPLWASVTSASLSPLYLKGQGVLRPGLGVTTGFILQFLVKSEFILQCLLLSFLSASLPSLPLPVRLASEAQLHPRTTSQAL